MANITRAVGKDPINPLVYGLMSLGGAYGDAGSTEARLKVLDEVYESGCRTWDDADIYGDTEDLVGQWFELHPERRKDIFLTTKGAAIPPFGIDSSPEYIKKACQKSLDRLKVSCIDLYFVHRLDQVTPIEKTMQALSELKQAGKIRYIGLSEVSARTLERACKIEHVDVLQIEYSPFALDIERVNDSGASIMGTCKSLGIHIFAYSPLGRGFLTGTITSPEQMANDWRGSVPTFAKEAFEKNMELVKAIKSVTEEVQQTRPGTTQSQVVLAWLLAQWEGIIPLFGTRSAARARENMGAVKVTLSNTEVKAIRDAAESLQKIGTRYPEGMNIDLDKQDTPQME